MKSGRLNYNLLINQPLQKVALFELDETILVRAAAEKNTKIAAWYAN